MHGLRFAGALVRGRPDVIYIPLARNRLGFLRDLLFLGPARLSRKPVVVHLHSTSFAEYYKGEIAAVRMLIRLAFGPRTRAIVLAESLREAFGPLIPPERVYVVSNGVPDIGGASPAESRLPVVLHMTTLWSEKGVFEVLDVAARIRTKVPEAQFVLAGPWYEDHERARAIQEIEQFGLTGHVSLVGSVDGERKAQLLREAAVFLFPSRYRFECQPLVVLEALAAGTPVVATRIGVLGETIQHGIEGLLAEVGDLDTLVAGTTALLRDQSLRKRMGVSARNRYERDYQITDYANRLADILTRDTAARTPQPTTARHRGETLAGGECD
jgi:glycosyltransferase involved in cell wall biosynthesis